MCKCANVQMCKCENVQMLGQCANVRMCKWSLFIAAFVLMIGLMCKVCLWKSANEGNRLHILTFSHLHICTLTTHLL